MGIGERIRRRRLELGFTRNELAERVRVTPSAIANYENDISNPKPDILIALFHTLEVDANYLYGDYLSDSVIRKIYGVPLTKEEEEAVKKYRHLTEDGKRLVRVVIDEEYERAMAQKWITLQCYLPGVRKLNMGFILQEYVRKIRIRETNIPEGTDFCFQIKIDRYEPVFRKDDVVAVCKEEVGHNDMGLFCLNGICYIRTLCIEENICRLRALNVMDEDIIVEKQDNLHCMGRIIGKVYGEFEIFESDKE